MEGKVVTNNQMPIGSPNGRLPMSSNYAPNSTLPMPLYLSQTQPNHHPPSTTPFLLDGGVYQGQPPTTTTTTAQPNQWNANSKVRRDDRRRKTLVRSEILSAVFRWWDPPHSRCPCQEWISRIPNIIRITIILRKAFLQCHTTIIIITACLNHVQVSIDAWNKFNSSESFRLKTNGVARSSTN